MKIELRRIRIQGESIDGAIYIDGIRLCETAENVSTLLPAGNYPVRLVKCKQYKRKMPVMAKSVHCKQCAPQKNVTLNTVLPCQCPMLKPGNGIHNRTDSSILLGQHICPGCLKHPEKTFRTLYQRIRKNIERGNPVILSIV